MNDQDVIRSGLDYKKSRCKSRRELQRRADRSGVVQIFRGQNGMRLEPHLLKFMISGKNTQIKSKKSGTNTAQEIEAVEGWARHHISV